MIHRRTRFALAAASLLPLAAALTGCGIGSSSVTKTATGGGSAALAFSGNLHGGQQPVTGSTVKLWAAGTTSGYGAGATLVAATTSDSNGNFGFDNVAGVSPCTTGQYLYLTATGGNSGSGANSSLAMMAALPTPCSATTGTQYVFINELTTVAAVTALQQFMTITPSGTVPWNIGSPATNTVGLANAFLVSSDLASSTTGTTATSSAGTVVASTVAGVLYNTTVVPDYTKINTLADILSYCINSAGGTPCNSLFVDVTPNSSSMPTDTIQAMYYLATNAAGLTMPQHSNAAGSPNYLCNTYVSANGPFLPTLACSAAGAATPVPADWAINVSFKAVNSVTAATTTTVQPGSIAIDANGNAWIAQASATGVAAVIGEINPLGQVILAPVGTTTLSPTQGWFDASYLTQSGASATQTIYGARAGSIGIDTAGNAWATSYYSGVTVAANTAASGTGTNQSLLVEVTPQGTSTGYLIGYQPIGLAIDGSNNIFFGDNTTYGGTSTTSRFYTSELQAKGGYVNYFTGTGRTTSAVGNLAVDESSNQYVVQGYIGCIGAITRTNDAAISGQTATNETAFPGTSPVTLATTTPPTCASSTIPDAKSNIWAAYTGSSSVAGYLEYIDVSSSTTAPTITQYAAPVTGSTTTGIGGLNTPGNLAIDGLGNIWVANNQSSSAGGISEFTPSSNGTVLTAKSPAATGVYGFGSSYAYGHASGPVIDGSGNVWVETTGNSTTNLLVGIAAPVVTPTAVAVKNGTLATRP